MPANHPTNHTNHPPHQPPSRSRLPIIAAELKALAGAVDWVKLLRDSRLLYTFLLQPGTRDLLAAASGMRDPIARTLLAHGLITEDEARPVKEGGLGMVPMLQRLAKRQDEGETGDS